MPKPASSKSSAFVTRCRGTGDAIVTYTYPVGCGGWNQTYTVHGSFATARAKAAVYNRAAVKLEG